MGSLTSDIINDMINDTINDMINMFGGSIWKPKKTRLSNLKKQQVK